MLNEQYSVIAKESISHIPYILSIAPMIGHTEKFYRLMMRSITARTWLYTDMIHDHTMLQKKIRSNLYVDDAEHPLVLQLGGENAHSLTEAAIRGEALGYDEININAGCPSKKMRQRKFGIYLMDDVDNSVEIIQSIFNRIRIPVSIKCRIGYDGKKYGMPKKDDYDFLCDYVNKMKEAGAHRVSVHARIAIIGGINADLNREIPPLKYEWVYQLAKQVTDYPIEINGNITSLRDAIAHLSHVDAVMIGREAVQNPLMFYKADEIFSSSDPLGMLKKYEQEGVWEVKTYKKAIEVVKEYAQMIEKYYVEAENKKHKCYVAQTVRHFLTFFDKYPFGGVWKMYIKHALASEEAPHLALNNALQILD